MTAPTLTPESPLSHRKGPFPTSVANGPSAIIRIMKEYFFEDGREIDPKPLETEFIPAEQYKYIHEKTVRACHDAFIAYNGGILLVRRKGLPAKDVFWPIGGSMLRGVPTEESLKHKVREECGLEITDIKELGFSRTFFQTDPFGHGHGTDTFNVAYFGRGQGELKLNDLHEQPLIVTPAKYTPEFRNSLDPYVRDFLDLALPLI